MANVAIATGLAGLVVLDIDPRNGGRTGFDEMIARVAIGGLESAPRVRTPGGGFHIYLAAPIGICVDSRSNIFPGVDVRAQKGMIVAPPSVCNRGGWVWESNAEHIPIAGNDLVALIRGARTGPSKTKYGSSRASEAFRDNRPICEGTRNTTLIALGGAMRKAGFANPEVCAALSTANRDRCRPPLADRELGCILAQTAKYPPGFDRSAYVRAWLPILKGNPLKLALFILEHAKADGTATPALKVIERETGMTQQRVSEAARALERTENGPAVIRTFRTSRLGRGATIYRLTMPSVDAKTHSTGT